MVARTGGLADTVIDANVAAIAAKVATGFVFGDVSALGLSEVIDRVIEAHSDPKLWQSMQRNADASPGELGKLCQGVSRPLFRTDLMTYHTTVSATLEPGSPAQLGAHFDGGGTNFAVFSEHAAQVFLCLP